MRELALGGLIALAFGLGSFYATDHFGAFSAINLVAGGVALAAALGAGARRLRLVGGPHSRPVILRGIAWIAAALTLAVAMERLASVSGIRFDWTFEGSYELSPATRKLLAELPGELTATLYYDPLDPRVRRTRLLLETLEHAGPVKARSRVLADAPEDADRFAVGSSNSVVLEIRDRFETVERPTEGSLYEALARLRSTRAARLLVPRGEGEGDLERTDDLGYSGLSAALRNEGYEISIAVTAALSEVPEGTDAVLLVAPRRPLRAEAIDVLRRYLRRGGALVVMLEPGVQSGVEGLLAEYGLTSPDALIVDPASGPVDSGVEGLDIIAFNYETHPITRGLDRNRMTFFPGTRPFVLRKPQPEDELDAIVLSSPRSWVSEDLSLLERSRGRVEPDGARQDYHAIVASGRYERDGRQTRIVALGDSDVASNRYLRALYNLDLVVNAVHWAVQREAAITLRPKIRETVQFPLPLQNTLRTLYGVGLLIPELLLIAGGVVWLRRRSA